MSPPPLPLRADLLLSAATLAALLPHASGAPVEDTPTAAPTGESSGEEVEVLPSDLLSASPVWHAVLGVTKLHKKEVSYFFFLNR